MHTHGKQNMNCALAIHRKEEVNMIKEGKNKNYTVSGRINTSQYLFEVKTVPQIFCNKTVQVYPTNYDSLYVVIDFGGFDLASGKGMGFSGGTSLQFRLTASCSYTNLSQLIQILLIQEHLTTSTWTINSIKEPNWIIYSSKAQQILQG